MFIRILCHQFHENQVQAQFQNDIQDFGEFNQLMTTDFPLKISPSVLGWWLWLNFCATLGTLWYFSFLPLNFAADYQLNGWLQTPSVAHQNACNTWPAFNGGGARSKISCFGCSKIYNFGRDAGLSHQVPNQTEHIFGILRPISITWQSFSRNPGPPKISKKIH